MLKHHIRLTHKNNLSPAAFRRLCVETPAKNHIIETKQPAAFRRLCVETWIANQSDGLLMPAAFRRLCVETKLLNDSGAMSGIQPPSGGCVLKPLPPSALRPTDSPAAFRRLCVETFERIAFDETVDSSRLQAAVC